MKFRCFLTKALLIAGSLLLVACDDNAFNNVANTDIRTEEGLLNVQSDSDDSSGIVNGLDDTSEGPSAVDGLSETQINAVQDELDAIDAPEAISVEG